MSSRPPAGRGASDTGLAPFAATVAGGSERRGEASGVAAERRLRGVVAVLVSRFPLITETFILREIQEMERQGQPVRLVPLIEEDPEVVHADAGPWTRRALTTGWLGPEILRSNLRRLRADPAGTLRVLGDQLRGALGSWNLLVRTLALFPKAVHLAERLQEEGVRHLHAHFATHPTTVARIIAALTDIDYSFTAHAHDIFVRHEMLRDKVRDARFVRVISSYNRDYLRDLYPEVSADKLKVIPVGIDVDAYGGSAVPERSFVRACLGPDRNVAAEGAGASPARLEEPLLLCVAALKPYKGIPVLLEACRRLRDGGLEFRCDLIGDGPLRGDVERMIDDLDLGDTVRLLGPRPQEEVARRMKDASALVLPSVVAPDGQMEGIPVVLMEAMASGCPVVSSRISGIPELVRDGVDGVLTEPGDATAVASAVRRVLEEPEGARRLARNAEASVRARHRLQDTTARLLRQLEGHVVRADAGLEELLAGWERLRGSRVGIRRVRERADSRVLEIVAADGRRVRELVLKSQRSRAGESRPPSRRATREFRFLTRCQRRGIGVPAPLELDEARAAILMERCRGDCLEERLRDVRTRLAGAPWSRLADDLRATGRWLRDFQRLGPLPSAVVGGEPGPPSIDAILEEAAAHVDVCLREGLLDPDEAAPGRWLDMLRASFRPESTRPVACHGDFWPGNVFVGDGGVEVIDFEGAGAGHPWRDAAYFLVHAELYLAHGPLRRRRAPLLEAFVEGLGDGRRDGAALRFFRIVVALELLAREARRREGGGDGRSSPAGRRLRCLRRIVAEG